MILSENLKMTVAIYARNFVRKIIDKATQKNISPGYLKTFISMFYDALVSDAIRFNIKKHLYLIFESLIQVYQVTEITEANIISFYNELFTSVQQMFQNQNVEVLKGVLLVCQAAILNIRPINLLAKVFPGISFLLCGFAKHYIELLSRDMILISAIPSETMVIENPNIANAIQHLDLMQQWVNVH